VIPISNPDGVIAGNYRTGLAGNDLNRQFIQPNPKLHPTICAIKKLVKDVVD
jgi:murein tripeptide amidase MpaA